MVGKAFDLDLGRADVGGRRFREAPELEERVAELFPDPGGFWLKLSRTRESRDRLIQPSELLKRRSELVPSAGVPRVQLCCPLRGRERFLVAPVDAQCDRQVRPGRRGRESVFERSLTVPLGCLLRIDLVQRPGQEVRALIAEVTRASRRGQPAFRVVRSEEGTNEL